MTLKSDDVSTRFDSLFGEKLVGARHAEDGRLYAILKDGDSTREEPVGFFPFVDVEYGPADVTVRLIAPFAELVTATRPYSEDEADYLL